MQRPKGNVRLANAEEKRLMAWVKEQDCCACGAEGPCIVDHAMGSAFRFAKMVIGHVFLLPLCVRCDTIKTQGSRRAFTNQFGKMWVLCLGVINNSPFSFPEEEAAIRASNQ